MWVLLAFALALAFAHVLMLLHHLLVLGLFLGSLFRRQQGQGIPLRLDDGHPEGQLLIHALFNLGFDRGQIGFLVLDEGFMFPFRYQNVGFRLNPCPV